MNLFDYLDKRNKRKHLRELIKVTKEERSSYSFLTDELYTKEDKQAFLSIVHTFDVKIKEYETALKELL